MAEGVRARRQVGGGGKGKKGEPPIFFLYDDFSHCRLARRTRKTRLDRSQTDYSIPRATLALATQSLSLLSLPLGNTRVQSQYTRDSDNHGLSSPPILSSASAPSPPRDRSSGRSSVILGFHGIWRHRNSRSDISICLDIAFEIFERSPRRTVVGRRSSRPIVV